MTGLALVPVSEAQRREAQAREQAKPRGSLKVLTAFELIDLDLPPREAILSPWLPTKGLAMLYGQRGLGKTHIALGVAFAVATGGSFLRWQAPKPRKVLVIDGEMPAVVLQERLARIAKATEAEMPDPSYLRILASDLQPEGLPDLSTTEGQDAIEALIDGAELVIFDNLSSLARKGVENDAESWVPVQAFLLRLRRMGVSVLVVHHAGKGGQQRGTSKREDVLDSVIALRKIADGDPKDGARFEVHFEKARGFYGKDAEPFEASLSLGGDGAPAWLTEAVEDRDLVRMREMEAEGISLRDIGVEFGINASTVSRRLKKGGSNAG